MGKLRNALPVKARLDLDDLWQDLDKMKALKLYFGNRQLQIAQMSVLSSPSHDETLRSRGAIQELDAILIFLKENHVECDKERQAKQLSNRETSAN